MFKKILTHLIILMLTVLPVQVISASAEFVSMQLSMSQAVEVAEECLHEMDAQVTCHEIASASSSSCEEQTNTNSCQDCTDLPQATSAMVLISPLFAKASLLKTSKISISHLTLNGITQKNLLRPPRILI